MRTRRSLPALILLFFIPPFATAGGPLVVGGPAVGNRPAFGKDGEPFIWNTAKMPIQYRVDPGPMSVTSSGTTVIDHNAGVERVQNMFAVWQGVSTATLSYSNAGPLLPAGSYTGGDLKTAQQFNDVMGSCNAGKQNPVIFDADGRLLVSLGLPPEVIGFNSGCALDTINGYLLSSAIVMNGQFQDGINSPGSTRVNLELTPNAFDEAITHEIGHFSGLDHSQINVDLLLQGTFPCDTDELAGLPLMFPFAFCQARKDAGLPVLSPDDLAWISSLYPNANTGDSYGTISGRIFFGDGASQVQGVNVIARVVDGSGTIEDESRRVAVSAVSGYLFTGNPGQSITSSMPQSFENNTGGDRNGSRSTGLIGYYEIAVPPGTYTVEVESVFYAFVGGSGVGPLSPPIGLQTPEFWNTDESAFDFTLQRSTITVHAGDKVTDIDIILNNNFFHRFDGNEDSGAVFDAPIAMPELFIEDTRA